MVTALWEKEGTLAHQFWVDGKADFPIYDMHGHMGYHDKIYLHCSTPEAMRRHLQKIGVARLVFSHHFSLYNLRENSQDVEVCRAFPDVFRMYMTVNPNFPEKIKEDIAKFDSWSPWCIGMKFHPDIHGPFAADKKYQYALDFANERGLIALYHTWGASAADNSAELAKVVSKYPNIKFFIGHCFYGEWDKLHDFASDHPDNVWFELTSIQGERNRLKELVQSVGSERIIHGTDSPWFDEYQAVGGILSADISDADKRNILYRNVEKLLGRDW